MTTLVVKQQINQFRKNERRIQELIDKRNFGEEYNSLVQTQNRLHHVLGDNGRELLRRIDAALMIAEGYTDGNDTFQRIIAALNGDSFGENGNG